MKERRIAHEKLDKLKKNLKEMDSLIIAFSGGVDSTFLLRVAHDVLGDKVWAVTARSATYPERENRDAVAFAESLGVRHIVIESEELDIEGFANNPVNRCYLCKNELFTKVLQIAEENHIQHIADGANHDDLGDYRPGMEAAKQLGVVSPLRDAGFSKVEIRILSKEMNLRTWDKPAFACLSSRFPYGQKITREALQMVDKAEEFLLQVGFRQVRVRHYSSGSYDSARIEVAAEERCKFFNEDLMDLVYDAFKVIGYKYTALDLKGYRTGSMNETLELKESF